MNYIVVSDTAIFAINRINKVNESSSIVQEDWNLESIFLFGFDKEVAL